MRVSLPHALLLFGVAHAASDAAPTRKPNFVFIMTDDQDAHLDSIEHQPAVQNHFIKQGTTFKKHYCTVALCCPSRVSLLTGKAAHNTNVTDVSPVSSFHGRGSSLSLQFVC